MRKEEPISYKSMLSDLLSQLSTQRPKDYKEKYQDICSSIIQRIKDAQYITAGKSDQIKLYVSDILQKNLQTLYDTISLCIDKYMTGAIADANVHFNQQWKKQPISNYDEHIKNKVFYRMRSRKEGEKEFEPSDLLHIPIDNRGIITNQRYSISGFPCLYASTSLYQCWEELRRPHLQELYAAGLLFINTLTLLDLRLIRNFKNQKQLEAFITRLPLIIACSIKTKDDKATFKAEYIIPQILLHTIINKEDNIDGILYSSMRKDYSYFYQGENVEDYSKNENIVVPAKVRSENSLFIDDLKNIVEITDPLNFEQELIKGLISFNKAKQYEKTIFGQMEQLLMFTPIYRVNNPFKISFQHLSSRLSEVSNQITLI